MLQGTCGTCHDTPSVGNHSFPTPLNIGSADPSPGNRAVNLGGLDVSYRPEISVGRKDAGTARPTNDCTTTTDLGQVLIDATVDLPGKRKVPIRRGLAARAAHLP